MPQNADEIYRFYDAKIRRMGEKSTRLILNAALYLPRAWYKPVVDFSAEARNKVSEAASRANGVIIASNHRSYEDFGVVASVIGKEPELRALTGRHFALAKVILFSPSWSGALKNPAVRAVVEGVGGVPVFRKKDMEAGAQGRKPAVDKLVETSARLVADGYNVMIFPHGTSFRGEGIGSTETGIGRIAVAAMELSGRPVEILPMGLYYPDENRRHKSFVHVGEPFTAEDSVDNVLKQTDEHLLYSYSSAQKLAAEQ